MAIARCKSYQKTKFHNKNGWYNTNEDCEFDTEQEIRKITTLITKTIDGEPVNFSYLHENIQTTENVKCRTWMTKNE